MTHPEKNCKRFTMATKVTIMLLGSSLKYFGTASHSSHSYYNILQYFLLSFFILYLLFVFNLTLKYSLRPSNWISCFQYFSCSKPTYLFMARIIFPNNYIHIISPLLGNLQWVTDFLKSSNYLVCHWKQPQSDSYIHVQIYLLKLQNFPTVSQKIPLISHLIIFTHNFPSAWGALPSSGCISTYTSIRLVHGLGTYIWI